MTDDKKSCCRPISISWFSSIIHAESDFDVNFASKCDLGTKMEE